MRRRHGFPVFLSNHALLRWRQRAGEHSIHNIQNRTRSAIQHAIKVGIQVDKKGRSKININPELYAIVIPNIQGGWTVITYRREEPDEQETIQNDSHYSSSDRISTEAINVHG